MNEPIRGESHSSERCLLSCGPALSIHPTQLILIMRLAVQLFAILLLLQGIASSGALAAAQWSIPMAGNAFRSAPTEGNQGFRRNGPIAWGDSDGVFSTYFHIDRPAVLELALPEDLETAQDLVENELGSVLGRQASKVAACHYAQENPQVPAWYVERRAIMACRDALAQAWPGLTAGRGA